MTNNFQKLAVAIAGAILSLGVIEAHPAQADIITYDFTAGTYKGFFSYDDSAPEPRNRFLPYFDVTEFNFNFLGTTFTKSNLVYDRRSGPLASLPLRFTGGQVIQDEFGKRALIPRGGTLTGFHFGNIINNTAPSGVPGFQVIGQPGTSESRLDFLYILPGAKNLSFGGPVTATLRTPSPVPEPDTNFATLGGLVVFGLGWSLRKKIASSKTT